MLAWMLTARSPDCEYHKQNPGYVGRISEQNETRSNIDLIGQEFIDLKVLNNGSFTESARAGSLARLGHLLDVQKVAGSSPVRPTKDNHYRLIHGCSMN